MRYMNNIKTLRTSRGMKQAELASYLKVSQGTLSFWESGKYEIDNKSLQEIAEYFGTTTDHVLGFSSNPNPHSNEITDSDIKFALFGGDVTDEKFEEVKRFAKYIKDLEK